jgi:hypothetical protein
MTDGHCFISYSVADGLNFVTQLSTDLEAGLPFIKTWFDKRDLESGENWDDQLASATESSSCGRGMRSRHGEPSSARSGRRMKSLPRRRSIMKPWMRRGWRCVGWRYVIPLGRPGGSPLQMQWRRLGWRGRSLHMRGWSSPCCGCSMNWSSVREEKF